ncbi:MAG: DUF1702 family protein [Saprospiraceae bacterium]|nr:DUF1702 family protein [Saprospiraceae bacterium]
MSDQIANRMEYIQTVFQKAQALAAQQPALDTLLEGLATEPPEFRSVGFEAASMEIALLDRRMGSEPANWTMLYAAEKEKQSVFLAIGLGWAFAKLGLSPDPWIDSVCPALRQTVYDGVGYYFGLFRGRRTIRHFEVPEWVGSDALTGFDQGVGRRVWYITKGDPQETNLVVCAFPKERRESLWRGVGIACAYVGGYTDVEKESLFSLSGQFRQAVIEGMNMAENARFISKSMVLKPQQAHNSAALN